MIRIIATVLVMGLATLPTLAQTASEIPLENPEVLDEVDAPSYRQMNCRKVVVDE